MNSFSSLAQAWTDKVLETFFHETQNLVVLLDSEGRVLSGNPAFTQRIEHYTPGILLHEQLTQPSQGRFKEMLAASSLSRAALQFASIPEKPDFECLLIPQSSETFVFIGEPSTRSRDTTIHYLTEKLKVARHTLEVKQIELESVIAQADEVSHTDTLTLLANRKRIISDLQREVAAAERHHTSLTIFLVDVDHFKLINDTYGHTAGDTVLRSMSRILKECTREIDTPGRYGGEEFLFLLPSTSAQKAKIVAERMIDRICSTPFILPKGQTIHATISIGIAQYDKGHETWEDLLNRADRALYHAKNGGRNQYKVAKKSARKNGAAV